MELELEETYVPGAGPGAPLAGPRSILLVEDDADLREVIAFALEHLGYVVGVARDGWEALQALDAGARPALILLDLELPIIDGQRFIRMVGADPDVRHIPIVVISGTRRSCGAVRTVRKPFELAELIDAIAPYVGAIHIAEPLH